MKKILTLFVIIFTLSLQAQAFELNGGVAFDVATARDYLQEGQVDEIQISGPERFEYSRNIKNLVYSYNNQKQIIGITVQYENEPDTGYIYDSDYNLIYIDKYDKPVNIYPHRGYRYNLEGKLILKSLTVSKKEQFRFTPNGKLLVHSVNGVIYDEEGKEIGTASKKTKQ